MTDERRRAAAIRVFDVVDDGLLVVAVDPDAGFPVVDANAAAARMSGLALDEVIGSTLAELQPPRVVAGFARRVDELLRTGHSGHTQFLDEGPAGRVTLDATLCPLPELGDDPPHVVAVLRDVSMLMRVLDTLDEVERTTRTGTWSWDTAGNIVRWSSQLYRVFGLQRSDLEPSLEGYLERVHPDDRDRVEVAIDHTATSGEPFEMRHRVVTPDDETRWLHCTGRMVTDLDGRPIRMSGTARLLDDDAAPTD